MSDQKIPWRRIASDELSAQIDPLGAQLSTLRDRENRDLLWDGDPAVWNGRAPLLFPIVGMLAADRYRLGTKSYGLPRHGFARGKLFEVADASGTTVTFRLKADDSTYAVYPFRFELNIRFAVQGASLSITSTVRNVGDEAMPASFGYHPAFRWPLPYGHPRAAHFLEFERNESAPVRRLDNAGLLTAQRYATPVVGRRLALEDTLFEDDVMILDAVQSRSVSYGAPEGPRIEVGYPNSVLLGLWTKPRANFICIEPWRGIADPEGFTGDFRDKPGVFIVAPGAELPIQMTITLTQG